MTKIFELLSSPIVRKSREEVHKEYCRTKTLGKISFQTSYDPKMSEHVDRVLSSLNKCQF